VIKSAGRLAVAGAAVQVAYGVLAFIFRYPAIVDRPYELLWALANIGMIANIAVWLANRVTTPALGLTGGGLAMLGNLIRVGISGVLEVRPNADVDLPIVMAIMLMFVGLALLGIATVRAHVLTGASAWAPLIVLAGGLAAAPFYSFDKVVHFILLGLLWGATWMHMALVGYRYATAHTAVQPTPIPLEVS
jgi:sulfite exporter TauE/SafE